MKKTVSLLCIKSKSGAHKQLTFYFQMWKYFCRHLHSSRISMAHIHWRSLNEIMPAITRSKIDFLTCLGLKWQYNTDRIIQGILKGEVSLYH